MKCEPGAHLLILNSQKVGMYNAMEINGVKTVGNNLWCGNGFCDHRALTKSSNRESTRLVELWQGKAGRREDGEEERLGFSCDGWKVQPLPLR